ncbi:MAG: NUDIX hydrolase [Thermodesulfobacteriota bacterium]|nr:NUDIX hydrolase [Thermodesulfobacteriota bacterium]
MNFCGNCGQTLTYRIPARDDRPRFICENCDIIYYENPKMVVGCIPLWQGRILFCKRSIEPQYGKWTIPAGYLENGETVMEGATRETFEEAHAKVKNLKPYALYDLTFINQVYLLFRGDLVNLNFGAGEESLEVKLFREDEIPWDHIAFSVIRETLRQYVKDSPAGTFPFYISNISGE